MPRILLRLIPFLLWPLALLGVVWASAALLFDFPLAAFRVASAVIFLLFTVAVVVFTPGKWSKLGCVFGLFLLVLIWWRTIEPRNDRDWQPDVERTAWAEIQGEDITLHNVRNFDYRSKDDFTPHWETRKVKLSDLTGLDIAINYWGSPNVAHPIASFQFKDAPPICITIEVRKEKGEPDNMLAGLFRGFELIYIVADERDVLRVRTNYRGENVFLYRTTATPDQARSRFLEYLAALNQLHEKPRWYNAITTNCTTSIRTQRSSQDRPPWDWRLLVNGRGDELLFERGALKTEGVDFAKFKEQALIDAAAQTHDQSPDFSQAIRADRLGFQ